MILTRNLKLNSTLLTPIIYLYLYILKKVESNLKPNQGKSMEK